jgi:hypothetical protein
VATPSATPTPIPLTITASDKFIYYGDGWPRNCSKGAGICPIYAPPLPSGTSLSKPPTCGEPASTTQPYPVVGVYATTCQDASDPRYSPISYMTGKLTVRQARLQCEAESYTITYGEGVPAIGWSCTGWQNGDGPTSLNPGPTCMSSAGSTGAVLSVGKYTATCSGAVDSNYAIHYLAGSLTVVPATWVKVTAKVGHGPSARGGSAMAYDIHDGYSILFGGRGCGSNGPCGDTWVFRSGKWHRLKNKNSPSPRVQPSMAYDSQGGYALLFGGNTRGAGNGGPAYGDSWIFRSGGWTRVKTSASPPARTAAMMAYDPSAQEVILFGGYRKGAVLNDTWGFKGGHWTKLHPATTPQARAGGSMTYDAADGLLILFGGTTGYTSKASALADTWTFSNGNWTQVMPASSPDTLYAFAFSYDPSLAGTILVGGRDPAVCQNVTHDMWEFQGGNWSNLSRSHSPSNHSGSAIDFDVAAGKLLLFGGGHGSCTGSGHNSSDTWELSTSQPTS